MSLLPKPALTPGASVLGTIIAVIWVTTAWITLSNVAVPRDVATVGVALALSAALVAVLVLQRRCARISQSERSAKQMYSLVSQTLEAVPVAVQIKDANLRYVWINPQHAVITGSSAARILGKTIHELNVDANLAAAVTAHDHRVLKSGRPDGPEEQVVEPRDGRVEYISMVSKIPLLTDGKVTHVATIAADVHAWQEAQLRADEVRRLLETVLEAAPITIHVTDREGRFRWANRAFRRQIGLEDRSPVGKTWDELESLIPAQPEPLVDERGLWEGGRGMLEVERRFPATPCTPERRLLVTKVPLHNAAGEVEQILTLGTDITALMQARAEADIANRLVEGILRHVPLSIQVKDTDLRFRWANHAFCQTVGRDLSDVLGKRMEDLPIPANCVAATNDLDRTVLASGETLRFDEQWDLGDTTRQMIVIKAPIPGTTGTPSHVITISADISELHHLRAEVDASRQRLQAVLDAVPVAIALKDTERRYVWVNGEFERVFERQAARLTGLRVEDVFSHGDRVAEAAQIETDIIQQGLQPPILRRLQEVAGQQAVFDIKRLPIRNAAGQIDGVLVVGIEVTQMVRTATELQRLNEDLEQRAVERALELAQVNEFVAAIVDHAPLPIITFQLDGKVRGWNPAAERITGYSEAEALQGCLQDLFPEDRQQILDRLHRVSLGTSYSNLETRRRRRDGTMIDILSSGAPLVRDDGSIDGGVGIWLDISEQRAAERQLRQAQKMEAIGQLTGNMAHDFNNILAVVIGNLDMLLDDLPDGAPTREFVSDAIAAAEKGAALTDRLLAFARKQALRPVTICISGLIDGMKSLLQHAVGETIVVETIAGEDPWLAKADTGQFESAILNLCVNARDAMPAGGRLTIDTQNTRLDAVPHADVEAGDYVCVSVTDTGAGIPQDIVGQVFEPFFTTKPVGKGSGLGLSIVYGFVKQSGGHIHVYSEVDLGTCVKLYLPRVSGVGATPAPAPEHVIAQGRGETILLVEDNPQLRRTSASTILALGYNVLAAGEADSALALLDEHPEIQLLFSDVVLPGGVNGFELARRAQRQKPGLRVVFVSGFVDPALMFDEEPGPDVEVLAKPFRRSELAARLRVALDARPPEGTVNITATNENPVLEP